MRRWPLRILLCLILGAITTVAVAWGCVWFIPPPPHAITPIEPPDFAWVEANRKTNDPIISHSLRHSVGVTTDGFCTRRSDFDRVLVRRHCAGWPWPSLQGGSWDVIAEPATKAWGETARVIAIDAIPVFRGPNPEDVTPLPVRPIWPGFLIDTLFYAAIWFGGFFAPGMAKRAIRRKRGRCPRCGYDLRGDLAAGCSECGWNREESAA